MEIENKNLKEIRRKGDSIIFQYKTIKDAICAYNEGWEKNVIKPLSEKNE